MSPEEVKVWNRAAIQGGGKAPQKGDLALAGLLLAHGLIMNGGVLHAVDVLNKTELATACDGYRFFGFSEVARLLMDAANMVGEMGEEEESRMDESYWAIVPEDEAIEKKFVAHFLANRKLYADR